MGSFNVASKATGGSAPSQSWAALAAVAAINATDAVNFVSKGAGGSTPFALTAVAVTGNTAVFILLLAPIWTFVIPISQEGSVGDRMVYPYLLALLNNVGWALYAFESGSKAFFYINLVGIGFQMFYIAFYLCFATGMKQKLAGILFLFVIVVSAVMTALVYYRVIHQHSIALIASLFGVLTQAGPLYDLVMAMWSKQVDGISLFKAFISLLNASSWTAYGWMVVPVNSYVVGPNLFGVVSALLQIVVYLILIYHKASSNSMSSDSNRAGKALQDHNRDLELQDHNRDMELQDHNGKLKLQDLPASPV